MTVPDRQLITDAFLSMLSTGTGKTVGDHKAPTGQAFPYHVLHVIPGGGYWGAPLAAPDAQADFVYQIDSVSSQRKNCEWAADIARRTVLTRNPAGAFQVTLVPPTGWKVADRVPDGGPGGVTVEGVPPNEVFAVAERFVLRVVPA